LLTQLPDPKEFDTACQLDFSDNESEQEDDIQPDSETVYLPDINDFSISMEYVNHVVRNTRAPELLTMSTRFKEQESLNPPQDDDEIIIDINKSEFVRWITLSLNDLKYCPDHSINQIPSHPTIITTSQYQKLNQIQHQIFVKCCIALIQSWINKLNLFIPADIIPNKDAVHQNQLIAHLIGPAGYGKSKVIHSLNLFASKWNMSDTIITTSFTGTAAKNINGTNLHALFGWSIGTEFKSPVSKNLIQNLSRATFVIVDEVSACAQYLIGCLSNALQEVTKVKKILGGLHCLLVGDWLQMPPINGTTLYSDPDRLRNISSSTYDGRVLGRDVWDSINYYVVLQENMRHRNSPKWIGILDRMRVGQIRQPDIDYINQMCYLNDTPNDTFQYTPLLTASNETRCQFNRHCTYLYAKQHNETVFQIPAIHLDKHIDSKYYVYPDNKTGHISMLLELVIGMPLSSTKNDRKTGLTNGSLGILSGIQWPHHTSFVTSFTNTGVQIKLSSCIPEYLFFTDSSETKYHVEGLPSGTIPMSCPKPNQVKFDFKNQKAHSLNLKQIAVIPAWSLTTDKSQGMTLGGCIIGVQSDTHRNNPPKQIMYVAWSRVIDPSNIKITQPLTLDTMSHFIPSNDLIMIDNYIKSKVLKEFE